MKTDGLKKIIKEAVREAIQEELKDILLEAVRSPKQIVRESIQPVGTPKSSFTQPTVDLRQKYKDVLGETALSFTSNDIQPAFRPQSSDPVNGNLGTGELGMDQIMGLLNSK
jgi:hypothetical protein